MTREKHRGADPARALGLLSVLTLGSVFASCLCSPAPAPDPTVFQESWVTEPDVPALARWASTSGRSSAPTLAARVNRILAFYGRPPEKEAGYRGTEPERSVRGLPAGLTDPILAERLSRGEPDPLRRLKAFHDVVALAGTGDRAADAARFASLASEGGFIVRTVSGRIKGRPEPAFWNQVRLGDFWYNVDCTTDSGFIDGSRFHRRYSTQQLFLPPRAVAYSRLAADPRRQLLAEPVSDARFDAEPLVEGEFFRLGLSLSAAGWLPGSGPELSFSVGTSSRSLSFSTQLTGPAASGDLSLRSWFQRGRGEVVVFGSPPGPGRYRLRLFAGDPGEALPPPFIGFPEFERELLPELDRLTGEGVLKDTDRSLFLEAFEADWATGRYYFKEDRSNPYRTPFVLGLLRQLARGTVRLEPVFETSWTAEGASSVVYPRYFREYVTLSNLRFPGPRGGVLAAGREVRFAFEAASFSEVALVQGDRWQRFKRDSLGRFAVSAIPEAGAPLVLMVPRSDGRWAALVEYAVGP